MYTDEDLDSAVSAGVLTSDAAHAFRRHVENTKHSDLVDEERFRLVSSFNDIFVTIACVILLIALGVIANKVGAWLSAGSVAVAAWLLAEFFVKQRRMALPAILLTLAFVGGVVFAVALLLGDLTSPKVRLPLAGLVAIAAAWLHWWRFRTPITVAAGAAAGIGSLLYLVLWAWPEAKSGSNALVAISGSAVFAWAMVWDMSDRERKTRRSDVAFWLHLLAAPLLIHPVFSLLGVLDSQVSTQSAAIVVILYIAIAIASLYIDRRALMVSALGYVLYVVSALMKEQGLVNMGFAVAALVIASALLLLSAFWHTVRRLLLQVLPQSLQNRLPPARRV